MIVPRRECFRCGIGFTPENGEKCCDECEPPLAAVSELQEPAGIEDEEESENG